MDNKRLVYALEAVLFASGEPVSSERLCTVLDIDKVDLESLALKLAEEYDASARGIKLIRLEDRYQLVSRPDYAEYIRQATETGKPPMLSQAALEVLAVIAYRQPVTKTFIESVRGVDSGYTISSLCDKGLAETCGRLDMPGRPLLYRTTEKFLRSFGLLDLEQLPYIEGLEVKSAADESAEAGGNV